MNHPKSMFQLSGVNIAGVEVWVMGSSFECCADWAFRTRLTLLCPESTDNVQHRDLPAYQIPMEKRLQTLGILPFSEDPEKSVRVARDGPLGNPRGRNDFNF